jgi:hypothetical protein
MKNPSKADWRIACQRGVQVAFEKTKIRITQRGRKG